MPKKNAVRVTPSTGNVFRDLGFSKEESEHLLVRADLLIQVQKIIASRRFTQAEAAKVLRITQPRVSDLLRGRLELFSTDVLIDMLARLGVSVRLEVNPDQGWRARYGALGTEEYFAERVAKGVIKKALHVLERAGKGNPPVPGDEPVPKRVSRPR